MSKPVAVPILQTGQSEVDGFAQAVKENVDRMSGQLTNSPKLTTLADTATLADLIAAYNKLMKRLDG